MGKVDTDADTQTANIMAASLATTGNSNEQRQEQEGQDSRSNFSHKASRYSSFDQMTADLKEKGLEDLANEILRLTESNASSSSSVKDGPRISKLLASARPVIQEVTDTQDSSIAENQPSSVHGSKQCLTASEEQISSLVVDNPPGAYNVIPTAESLRTTSAEEYTDNVEIDTESTGGPALLPPTDQQDPTLVQGPDTNSNGALEAIRVDDIMTVKAEPLENHRNSNACKILTIISSALVAIVLSLSLAFTRRNDSMDLGEGTPSPTYDPPTRFQLIQQLLVEEFSPLYNQNYNATNGTLLLQDAFQNNVTPQYKALHWIATMDSEIENVTIPYLEEFGHEAGTNRRHLQRISRDRIVQRYVLAVLYFSTGNWTDSFEFLSEGHECDWSGSLQCSSNQTITYLDLLANALKGTIPLELGALTHLETLSLASNELVGTLPPSLHALSKLILLDLGFNKLNGTIPDAYFQNWERLKFWSLAECNLTGTISSNVGYLGSLTSLQWQLNNFSGTVPPNFWSQLTNLEEMDLSQQTGRFINDTIGTEIGMWSNIRVFSYHGLDLRGTIPTEIGQLSLLDSLQIASNHLSGTIPTELGLLTAVSRLSLSMNALTGTVPTNFVQLSALTQLYLQNTLLTGNVSFLCQAITEGKLQKMDPMRVDMAEVSGCSCCTCCLY